MLNLVDHSTVLVRVLSNNSVSLVTGIVPCGGRSGTLIDQVISGPHLRLFVFCICQLRIYGVHWKPEDIWSLWKEMPVLHLRKILIHISLLRCTFLCWFFNQLFPSWPSLLSLYRAYTSTVLLLLFFSEPNQYKLLTLHIPNLISVLCRFWPFRGIRPAPGPCLASINLFLFTVKSCLSVFLPRTLSKLEYHPLSAARDLFFTIFAAALCVSWGRVMSRWRGLHLTGPLPAVTLKWSVRSRPSQVEQCLFSLLVSVVLHVIENRDGFTFVETQQEDSVTVEPLVYLRV